MHLNSQDVLEQSSIAKSDEQLRTVAQLRTEVDDINTDIDSKVSELKGIDNDIALLADQTETKTKEITQLKEDLSASLRANSNQKEDIQSLLRKSNEVQLENERTQKKVAQVSSQVDDFIRQNNSLDELVAGLEKEISGLQADLRAVRLEVQDKGIANDKRASQLKASQSSANEAEKVADSLDRDIQYLEQELDKNTSIALSSENKLESEVVQGQELDSRLRLFERELDLKITQFEELKKSLTQARNRNADLKGDNDDLSIDIEECRAHLEDLIQLNKRVTLLYQH